MDPEIVFSKMKSKKENDYFLQLIEMILELIFQITSKIVSDHKLMYSITHLKKELCDFRILVKATRKTYFIS
jgi:hypothetical protein